MPIRQSTREQVTAMIEKPDDPRTPIQNALHARYMALVTDNQAAAEALASDAIEEVERLELLISDYLNRQVPTPAIVVDVITEYDTIIAGIPAFALVRDGDEADFVMRVADYRTLRDAICTAHREEQPK